VGRIWFRKCLPRTVEWFLRGEGGGEEGINVFIEMKLFVFPNEVLIFYLLGTILEKHHVIYVFPTPRA
jgi:hypothetical protein